MAKVLFITPQEITQTTIMNGNVDVDKYKMCIEEVQLRFIEPLLGSELYDKIIADILGDGLTGLYLEMFNDYIKPITKYEAISDYVAISPYTLANNGLFKNSPDNVEVVSVKEVEALSDRYGSISQTFVNRFAKWIRLNKANIPEYKLNQDGVDAEEINVNNGWYFD